MQSVLKSVKQFLGHTNGQEPAEAPAPAEHTVTIFGPEGITELSWVKGDKAGEAKAQAAFEKLINAGFIAVAAEKGGAGQATAQVTQLDESIESVELLPQLRGG